MWHTVKPRNASHSGWREVVSPEGKQQANQRLPYLRGYNHRTATGIRFEDVPIEPYFPIRKRKCHKGKKVLMTNFALNPASNDTKDMSKLAARFKKTRIF